MNDKPLSWGKGGRGVEEGWKRGGRGVEDAWTLSGLHADFERGCVTKLVLH